MTSVIVAIILASLGCLLAIYIAWVRFYVRYPLQATLRAAMAVLALLAANLALPAFEGKAMLDLDLYPPIRLHGEEIRVTTRTDVIQWGICFGSISLLAAICLMRVRDTPTTLP